jgi:hypothetical protein
MLLAAHPEEQRLLQAEIDTVLQQGKRQLAYEDLDKLVLCQGAMNEALRLFPPVVIVPKVCVPEGGAEVVSAEVSQCVFYDKLDSRRLVLCTSMGESLTYISITSKHLYKGRRFHVPKGAVLSVNVYALHRNPKHYPDPDAFRHVRLRVCLSSVVWVGRLVAGVVCT